MTRILMLACFAVFLTCSSALSLEEIERGEYCVFDGSQITDEKIYLFPSDESNGYGFTNADGAFQMISKILELIGIDKANFELSAGTVPNASAIINGNRRYVVWNQNFILYIRNLVGEENADWAIYSILAHEFGHHLEGHTLLPGGSRPSIELEADRYSGFLMYQLGANLDQAHAAMKAFGSEQGSNTHPSRNARLAAITNGWNKAQKVASEIAANTGKIKDQQSKEDRPSGQTQEPVVTNSSDTSPADLKLVAQCFFYGDGNQYFVTSTNDIIGQDFQGNRLLVGKRVSSHIPNFVWLYQHRSGYFGVDSIGRIWGSPQQLVGHVMNL